MSWGEARGLFAEERGPVPAHSLEISRSETLDSLRLISALKNPLNTVHVSSILLAIGTRRARAHT